jgi:pimeloyl-ACP methyl ester carboxylesterase
MSRIPRTDCHPALSDIGAALARDCADSDGLECRRVLVDGAEIFFQVALSEAPSHRPPVVLVHGYGMSSRYMVPLIGNWLGCQVLVEFAVRQKDRVDCLVLQGLTADPAAHTVRQQVWRQLVDSRHEGSRAITRIAVRDYAAAGPRRLLLTLRHTLSHRIEEQLPLITVPTLVVRGTRDAVVPHGWARRAASPVPRGRLLEVESGSDIMHFHAPDRLARVVRRFLQLPPDRVRRVQARSNQ